VDPQRLAGTWYEVARLPNLGQAACEVQVSSSAAAVIHGAAFKRVPVSVARGGQHRESPGLR
jgi:hypothetical protein